VYNNRVKFPKKLVQLLDTGTVRRHVDVEFETGLFMALFQLKYLQSGQGREHKTTGLGLEDRFFHSENDMRQRICKQQAESEIVPIMDVKKEYQNLSIKTLGFMLHQITH